jgi:hypothetical protein
MQGAVLYGQRDVRFESATRRRSSRRRMPSSGFRPLACGSEALALPRRRSHRSADADGARVLRNRRGGRPRDHDDQARLVRHRFVLRLRQHVPQLSGRLSDILQAPRARRWHAGASAARAARGRHPGGHPGVPSDDLIPSLLTLSIVPGGSCDGTGELEKR